jgi:hypothetical protein
LVEQVTVNHRVGGSSPSSGVPHLHRHVSGQRSVPRAAALSVRAPILCWGILAEPAWTPEQISATWEQGLRPIQATHHQAGNYRVDIHGEQATAFCYGIAVHYRETRSGRNTRTFVGSYDFHLLRIGGRWRIDSFRFNLKFLDGNLELEQTE